MAFAKVFGKAVRQNVWLRISLGGTSGSGKSFSALRMATGLSKKCNSRIAFISTEKSRTLYYADQFDYDVLELEDYSPESYIEAIDAAIDAGYKVIIVDSLSHCWQFINDIHSKMPGNSFQNWGKLKPRWGKLMQKILEAPAHIITCSRAKTEWAMEDKNGKQVPKKVGLGNEGDKQADFEYTVALMIEQGTHIASVGEGGKDNTGLFEGKYEVLTEKHGEMLYDWANSTDIPPEIVKVPVDTADTSDDVAEIKKQITAKCKEIGGQKNEELMAYVKEHGRYNGLEDIAALKNYYKDVCNIKSI